MQPVVTLSSSTAGGSICSKTSKQLLDNVWKRGYTYIKSPHLPPEMIREMKRQGRLFHSPNSWKNGYGPMAEGILSSESDSGFRGCYRYVGASGVGDHIDCFSIGKESADPWSELRGPYYSNQRGLSKNDLRVPSQALAVNKWPTPEMLNEKEGLDAAAFQQCMVQYFAACHATSMDVLRHLADALGVIDSETLAPDVEYFTAKHQRMDSNLEMKFYPVFNDLDSNDQLRKKNQDCALGVDGTLLDPWSNYELGKVSPSSSSMSGEGDMYERLGTRLATHQDLSSVTLLAQDNIGGLEVLDQESGKFIAVPIIEDAILINAGVYLEKWTAGVIDATPHRVTKKSSTPPPPPTSSSSGADVKSMDDGRLSCVFFCFPDHDAVITPMVEGGEKEQFLGGDLMPE